MLTKHNIKPPIWCRNEQYIILHDSRTFQTFHIGNTPIEYTAYYSIPQYTSSLVATYYSIPQYTSSLVAAYYSIPQYNSSLVATYYSILQYTSSLVANLFY